MIETGLVNATEDARRQFAARAYGLMQTLTARPEKRWALACDDTEYFALGLLALLAADKQVVLPQAARPASVCAAQTQAILSDMPVLADFEPLHPAASETADTGLVLQDISDNAGLELCTSGSTGTAKRVTKHFGQLRAEIRALDRLWRDRIGDAPVLSTVPHYHLYGLLFRVLWPLWAKRALARHTCLHPFELTHATQKGTRCVIVSSPAFLSRIKTREALPDPALVAALFSSGTPLASATASWLASGYGLPATEVYGSTETGGIAWREQRDGDTAWTPLPDVELRASETLQVRSPWTWDRTWAATGDRASFAADGRLQVHGRGDAVLKFEDKRISLTEMAARLCKHPAISDARVIVVPGARHRLGAVVALSSDARFTPKTAQRQLSQSLRDALRQYYDPVLIPRKWRYVDALPENAMGKVTQQALLELFAAKT